MIVLHKPKRALNHSVLKERWPIQRRDLASELLPHAKVLCPPGHAVTQAEHAGGDASGRYRGFSTMNISSKVHFDAS
jgi:hypothetical protein